MDPSRFINKDEHSELQWIKLQKLKDSMNKEHESDPLKHIIKGTYNKDKDIKMSDLNKDLLISTLKQQK
jgi:hypothetical protein